MNNGRLELKFCVPERVAARVLDVARTFLAPEPLAKGPRQRITSLYLDTPDMQFLRWHRDRFDDRFKLRIRRYGDGLPHTLYSEVKRKTQSVVRKERHAFEADDLYAILDSCHSFSRAEPRVLITGVRESLRDPRSEDAVTVDRALRYQSMRRGDLVGAVHAWLPLPLPRSASSRSVLLELKFASRPPAWMEPLVRDLQTFRTSFSKYAAAMNGG